MAMPSTSIGNLVRFAPKVSNTIYREKVSGKSVKNRPELERAIDALGTGDILAGSSSEPTTAVLPPRPKAPASAARRSSPISNRPRPSSTSRPAKAAGGSPGSWACTTRRSEGWRGSAQRRSRQP